MLAAHPTYVETADAAQRLAQLAQERAVSRVGMSVVYGYSRPPIQVPDGEAVYDPRRIQPLMIALAIGALGGAPGAGESMYRFVVDLQCAEALTGIRTLMRLPVPFVVHDAGNQLACLWSLGLDEPDRIWDTRIAQRVQGLGRHHPRYTQPRGADLAAQIEAKRRAEAEAAEHLTLARACRTHGVDVGCISDGAHLSTLAASCASDQPFTLHQLDRLCSRAVAAAALHPRQIARAAEDGTLDHLVQIEMPWVTVNARMVWHGLRVDAAKAKTVVDTCGPPPLPRLHGNDHRLGAQLVPQPSGPRQRHRRVQDRRHSPGQALSKL